MGADAADAAGGDIALVLYLDPATGALTLATTTAIAHPVAGSTPAAFNDPVDMNDTFFLGITDGDGDVALSTNALEVVILDDGPDAQFEGGEGVAVFEEDLPDSEIGFTGVFNIDFGTDGPADGGGLTFDPLLDGTTAPFTAGGETVTYSLSADGQILTASSASGTVFTVELGNPEPELFTVELLRAVDHDAGVNGSQFLLEAAFDLRVTDGDGDFLVLEDALEIAIFDDEPTVDVEAGEGVLGLDHFDETPADSAVPGDDNAGDDEPADPGAIGTVRSDPGAVAGLFLPDQIDTGNDLPATIETVYSLILRDGVSQPSDGPVQTDFFGLGNADGVPDVDERVHLFRISDTEIVGVMGLTLAATWCCASPST